MGPCCLNDRLPFKNKYESSLKPLFITAKKAGCSLRSPIDHLVPTERRLAVNFQHLDQ